VQQERDFTYFKATQLLFLFFRLSKKKKLRQVIPLELCKKAKNPLSESEKD
jgi:hypothetical protein